MGKVKYGPRGIEDGASGSLIDTSDLSAAAGLSGLTATIAEVNATCDGNTATAAEITSVCDGNTATAAEITAVCDGATASAAELNARNDDSAMVDTRVDAGVVSTGVSYTDLSVTTGSQAITLAVPTKPAFIKIIKMTANAGTNATLALTNVVGGSAATTATFDAVGETLTLVSDTVSGKWIVLSEVGVTLS